VCSPVEKPSKYYSIGLTNEKGIRSYIYVLKIYEKILNFNNLPFFEGGDGKGSNENVKLIFEEIVKKDQQPNGMEEHDDCVPNMNLNLIEKNKKTPFLFFPYAICLWSSISNIDSFKEILQEIHRILFYSNVTVEDEMVKNFQFTELMNFLNFLDHLVKPPAKSVLKLNLRIIITLKIYRFLFSQFYISF